MLPLSITQAIPYRLKKIFYKAAETAKDNKDSAIAVFKEALNLSREIDYTYGVARSMLAISSCKSMKGEYTLAIKMAEEAYKYCAAGQQA